MPYKPAPPMDLATFREYVTRFRWSRVIDEVHMHHTWEPNHATWAGERSVIAMRDYHVDVNKWADIAQHVTIDPTGMVWLGRDWNRQPASSAGHNGTSARGPFMFETVGNFDVGHESLAGDQRATVLGVIAAVQQRFGLAVESLRFHRQLGSPKTCPGSGINYDTFLAEVRAYRLALEACP
jgi:N-acetylmuramoyl-L-alanine amidase-like protein